MFFQVNWRFEGPAAVFTFVSNCFRWLTFWHSGYRMMWLNFPIVELKGRLQLMHVYFLFLPWWCFFLLGECLAAFIRGVFDREFGQLLPFFSARVHIFWYFWMCSYVLDQFCLCRFPGMWVVSLILCFLFSYVHLC